MGAKVIVLGGGVAGMTTAHELAQRGFDVAVYERRAIPGGKARSFTVEKGQGVQLPAEHGFRFFPGFYRHLPDTMRRIPCHEFHESVYDHLVPTTHAEMAGTGGRRVIVPDRFPTSVADARSLAEGMRQFVDLGVSWDDLVHFAGRLLVLLTSCEQRRYTDWEDLSWWEFVDAANRSHEYRQYLADGMTRKMVAARAREISARTCGYTLLQLMSDFAMPGNQMDRVLDGPTNSVWIDRWRNQLETLGVEYHTNHTVEAISCSGGRIDGVSVKTGDGQTVDVKGDYYVGALPVTTMAKLVDGDIGVHDPELKEGLDALGEHVRWMEGMQFYLRRDIPLVHGHVIYIDSPFSLTSISPLQFWRGFPLESSGRDKVRGILSVDISDWTKPVAKGGMPASEMTAKEVKDAVWAQVKEALNGTTAGNGSSVIDDDDLVDWFLDEDVEEPGLPAVPSNAEPMLINVAGSWGYRPDATTGIDNFYLAGDYVRTFTDLACMEGANEAARRAVNGILEQEGRSDLCDVWRLHEPEVFAPLRLMDELRFNAGLPHAADGSVGKLGSAAMAFASEAVRFGASTLRTLDRLRPAPGPGDPTYDNVFNLTRDD